MITRRGRIVRAIAIAIAVLAVLAVIEDKTTPAKCKVPTSQMSQGCKDLLFPN